MKPLFLLLASALLAHAAPVKIVAAENFYGGVAKLIAGDDAEVTSILSNPNQDPHEFTTNASTAKAVADADIVIYNGLGYDGWMEKLLSSPGKKDRKVICVSDLMEAKEGDNPHLWYNTMSMTTLTIIVGVDLDEIRVSRGAEGRMSSYASRAGEFEISLFPVWELQRSFKESQPGLTVTATEPVFGYMARDCGFKMLNGEFQIAVMNDAEPSASLTAAFEKSLTSHAAKILFYNSQVTDPATERLKQLATKNGMPIVGVTETQPADEKSYADWMLHTLQKVKAAATTPAP